MKKPEIDWIIHCCRNGVVCDEYGDVENGFVENSCNAHTHGMNRYQHPDFQLVLALPNEEICRICNLYNRHGDGNGYMGSGDCIGEKEDKQGLTSYMCLAASKF